MVNQVSQMISSNQPVITLEAFVVVIGFGILLMFISSAAMYNFRKRRLAFLKMTKANEEISAQNEA